jgi:hypothetical protein
MFNIVNTVPYIKTSRDFPNDADNLSQELDKSYIEIAQAVNLRIIGLFSVNRPAITGESWFLNKPRQQTLRQVYIVPAGITTGSTIDLGFKIDQIYEFSPKCYGSYTDGTDSYGLIFASNTPITGQISFYLHVNAASTVSDQIVFVVDGAAPAITSGLVIIEWISDV